MSYRFKRFYERRSDIFCPYCGEPLIIEPEPNVRTISYVEDCHVCCQPIVVSVSYSEEGSQVWASREND